MRNKNVKNVVIIGGGASGMIAALTAAEDENNNVILLERQQRVGRKLLATGNGRCNLTNVGATIANYHGENPEFAEAALSRFSPDDTLRFFKDLGLVTVTEYGGRVYPLSNSANSVVDVLRFALEQRNVTLKTSCPAREIRKNGEGFTVITDEEKINADALIMACGGAAGAKLGGVMDGYELLKPLGHKRTNLRPSLVQLICDPTYPRALKGVRAEAALRLTAGKMEIAKSKGELQFIEAGLSGPAAFDISRAASFCDPGAIVHIDFLHMLDTEAVIEILKHRTQSLPKLGTDELLTGVLHNRLGRMLVKYAGVGSGRELKTLADSELERVANACKDFCIELKGVESFDCAQVTAGGIKTSGINPETLESWFVPNLYICGELLDVDADCGGYNLQWAWASGHLAGRLGK